jgi:two-component sensor histidine kinase
VEEKDLRLREIHHRIKNNLQIISSLLTLQAGELSDPVAAEGFRESRMRIQSRALVHEQLYAGGDLSRLDLAGYVSRIGSHLFETYVPDQDRIRLELDLAPASLPIDKAIPCGLIVNELTTNAFKHAFPTGRTGTVGVHLSAADGLIRIEVVDDGVCLPPDQDPATSRSLGLKLVTSLTASWAASCA